MPFLEELKRRNVFRVGVAYVVVAWLLIQVAETIFPLFGYGDTPARTVVVILAIGMVPVLVLAWVFELTPEGLKKEKDIDRSQSITPQTGKKLDRTIMVVLALAAGYFAFDNFVLDPRRAAEREEQIRAAVEEARQEGLSQAVMESDGDKSIAVLPFVNMSGMAENEYFSDGLTETLLHMLAQVPDLKVAARTSSFSFKGKNSDVREIADALSVAHLLEGSVQRAGDRIRVTAQLIRASDGFHMWSESYDRTLDDIFAIQDEIASRVGMALSRSLLGEGDAPEIEGVGTQSVRAYDLYLKAVTEQAKDSYGSLGEAESLLKEALAIDPGFLDAKIELASNYWNQASTGLRKQSAALPEMTALLDQVLEARPDNVRARGWMLVARTVSALRAGEQVDLEAAIAEMEALERKAPSEVDIKRLLIAGYVEFGRYDDAIATREALLELDPLNPQVHRDAGEFYMRQGLTDKALQSLERSLELEPYQPGVYERLAYISLQRRDAVGYVEQYLKAIEVDPKDHELPGTLARFLFGLGLFDEGDRMQSRMLALAPTSPASQATQLRRARYAGDVEESLSLARQMIEKNVENRSGAWDSALEVVFDYAAKKGEVEATLAFVEAHVPGLRDFDSPASPRVKLARLSSLAALSTIESPEATRARLARLDEFIRTLLTPGPYTLAQIQAYRGETELAVETVLTQAFARPAIRNLQAELMLDLHSLSVIAADPWIQEELEKFRQERSKAAGEVRAYFAARKP
jgi:TolB-like protein/Tfp pilus assembly protein PilF